MHKLDPVETILARLMPSAMSQEGQEEISAMLDELAGVSAETVSVAPTGPRWLRRVIAGGIAAAVVGAAMVFQFAGSPSSKLVASAVSSGKVPAGFVLVSESDRVESMTDEGWHEDSDGGAVRALRLNVVEENSLLDEETGIVMQVSEPREEFLLMPVSAF